MFETILIANRGEIARRVIRTCRRLGIRTVAVFSDADRDALFVREADAAFHIGGPLPRDSYLRGERILEAAEQGRAAAIHPGYGFLSENAAFARACAASGVRFIGPPPDAIEAMGLKDRAKAQMEGAGVPIVPGYHGADQDPQRLEAEAKRIGFPVLIKAVAGGGGKGMRRVEQASDFRAALDAARREAEGAFGDTRVLVEKYLARPRHIEVQVFADRHGHALHLFERDCSLQRRHQKVIEEAPAPGLSAALRAHIGGLAVRAAQAIGYEGAGTVELIADSSGGLAAERFYFMEMNTRLQVEHPVTEMITGLDLVEWQLRVAAGEALPVEQDHVPLRGHAFEARLYAEDPGRGYLPQTGTLLCLRLPEESEHVRIDRGVAQGDTIGTFYDPMIAKLIAWGQDRPSALGQLRRALCACEVAGLATNLSLLSAIATHPAFAAGAVHTGFLEEHATELGTVQPLDDALLALACAGHLARRRPLVTGRASNDAYSPWDATDAFRLAAPCVDELSLMYRDERLDIEVSFEGRATRLRQAGRELIYQDARCDGDLVTVTLHGQRLTGSYVEEGRRLYVCHRGRTLELALGATRTSAGEDAGQGGQLRAPMPGRVTQVLVAAGQVVRKGTALLRLEAMKMEHTLVAPFDGTIADLAVGARQQVEEGRILLKVTPGEVEARGSAREQNEE